MLETRVRGTTSAAIVGVSPSGTPVIGGTSGSVLFVDSSGNLGQDNANLFWDNTSKFLRVPTIIGGSATTADLTLQTTSGVGASGADMHFLVGNNGATEAMTILNSGNVGIGTTNPGTKLELSGGSMTLTAADLTATNGAFNWTRNSSGGTAMVVTQTNTGDIVNIFDGATEVFTILDGGNVGIGTTTPGAVLDVSNSAAGTPNLHISNSGTAPTYTGLRINTNSATNAFSRNWFVGANVTEYGDFQIIQSDAFQGNPVSAGTARFVIENTGNVGIGTTAPDAALEINHATGDNLRLTYNDSNGGATVYSDFSVSSSGDLTITPSGGDVSVVGTLAASTYFLRSVGNALTAVGTTRTDALQLAKEVNNVTTAAAGTGVILPVGVIGMRITIFNAGANLIQVYASASETIDAVAGATGVPLTNAKRCDYFMVAANTWISMQGGAISA